MDGRPKRAHDEPAIPAGYRVLIARLWPRGVSKTDTFPERRPDGRARKGRLTLVHSARDEEGDDAVVPAEPPPPGRRSS